MMNDDATIGTKAVKENTYSGAIRAFNQPSIMCGPTVFGGIGWTLLQRLHGYECIGQWIDEVIHMLMIINGFG